jgi:hypothetical protein
VKGGRREGEGEGEGRSKKEKKGRRMRKREEEEGGGGEHEREGIKWTPIKYFNNKVVCELIEGKWKRGREEGGGRRR